LVKLKIKIETNGWREATTRRVGKTYVYHPSTAETNMPSENVCILHHHVFSATQHLVFLDAVSHQIVDLVSVEKTHHQVQELVLT
jgi:hypothetical protein